MIKNHFLGVSWRAKPVHFSLYFEMDSFKVQVPRVKIMSTHICKFQATPYPIAYTTPFSLLKEINFVSF